MSNVSISLSASTIISSGFLPNCFIMSSIARCKPFFVASNILISSISCCEISCTLHAKESSMILSYRISLRLSVTFFESLTHSRFDSGFIITAPTDTGPANGPLPASSIPQISIVPSLYSFSSYCFSLFRRSASFSLIFKVILPLY